jgi:hypothetical protein
MSHVMKKKWVRPVLVGVVALGAGLVAGRALWQSGPGEVITRASWKDVYEVPADMVRDVDAVVVARFEGSDPGRTAVGDHPEAGLSYLLNRFAVEDALSGDPVAGTTLVVEQTAETGPQGALTAIDSDGGPYAPGATYLLFLKKQADTDYYYVVSPQGRFEVRDGLLDSAVAHLHEDPVASALDRRPLGEVTLDIDAILAGDEVSLEPVLPATD